LLLAANCTVTVAHSRTRDLAGVCRLADILVVAVGQPEMVKADWIKPGATVLDVGMNRAPSRDPDKAAAGKTRLVGDVDFAQASTVAGRITPVPGGIGPMTIACLLRNAIQACADSRGIRLATLT
jgi:methylenetetrahydrofolate dehydrogenase (NADP+)/methenyltetrahydrofolate cyclohydrolase